MDSTSIRVPYKNLRQAEVELNRLDELNHRRSPDGDLSNSNGVSANASQPPQRSISMLTLVLSCTVAAGVQFGWALQLSLLTPYIQTLGIGHAFSSFIWLCGPITGLVVQPCVGIWSDKCTSKYGRRRPFILVGSVMISISVIIIGFSADIGYLLGDSKAHCSTYKGTRTRAAIVFILGFWMLDLANNTVQGPARAILADLAGPEQRNSANAIFCSWMAVGNVLGFSSGASGKWHTWFPFLMSRACCEACGNLKAAFLVAVNVDNCKSAPPDENKFKRIYICYHSLKTGWRIGCRPVLGLDGCFLKTVTGGQLLSAIGRDGNNQMFPVAWAVVEGENQDSWRWFLDLLKDDMDLGNGYGLTIISDQQKGLENAVKEFLPDCEHRYCSRHLYANFRKKYPSSLCKRFFWQAATATYPQAHVRAMKQIEKLTKEGYEQLKKLEPKKWSKAYFATTSHSDNVENNMSECFNAWIINERYLPVLNMLQEIHFKIMNRMRTKRDEMLRSDMVLCPRIKRKLDRAVTESREWRAVWDGARKFQVKCGTRAVTVDLIAGSCDCRVFDLTGIPCAHAISAIHERREQPIDHVSVWYRRERYLDSYRYSVEAIKGEEYWEICDAEPLLPPDIPTKLRGRPKKLRRREAWEGNRNSTTSTQPQTVVYNAGRVMHCSYCKQPNHKRPTCPDIPRDEEGNIIEDLPEEGQEIPEQPQSGVEVQEEIGSTNTVKKKKIAQNQKKKRVANSGVTTGPASEDVTEQTDHVPKKSKKAEKLPVKRTSEPVLINEPATQESRILQTPKPSAKGKGKTKVGDKLTKDKFFEATIISSPTHHQTPFGDYIITTSEQVQPKKKTIQPRQTHSAGGQARRSSRIKKKCLFSNTTDTAVQLEED